MLQERRKTQRYAINHGAKILVHADDEGRDCLVADISDGGVRLFAQGIDVPNEFILLMEGIGETGRKCRVVWRLDSEIGAEFIDGDGAQR